MYSDRLTTMANTRGAQSAKPIESAEYRFSAADETSLEASCKAALSDAIEDRGRRNNVAMHASFRVDVAEDGLSGVLTDYRFYHWDAAQVELVERARKAESELADKTNALKAEVDAKIADVRALEAKVKELEDLLKDEPTEILDGE